MLFLQLYAICNMLIRLFVVYIAVASFNEYHFHCCIFPLECHYCLDYCCSRCCVFAFIPAIIVAVVVSPFCSFILALLMIFCANKSIHLKRIQFTDVYIFKPYLQLLPKTFVIVILLHWCWSRANFTCNLRIYFTISF